MWYGGCGWRAVQRDNVPLEPHFCRGKGCSGSLMFSRCQKSTWQKDQECPNHKKIFNQIWQLIRKSKHRTDWQQVPWFADIYVFQLPCAYGQIFLRSQLPTKITHRFNTLIPSVSSKLQTELWSLDILPCLQGLRLYYFMKVTAWLAFLAKIILGFFICLNVFCKKST